MAKYIWEIGQPDRTALIFIQDSSSTTGAGRTSVVASWLNAQGIRVETDNDVVLTTISVTNLAALTDAYALGGLLAVSNANAPGWYRFDIPNWLTSGGATSCAFSLIDSGANNVAPVTAEIQFSYVPANVFAITNVSPFPSDVISWAGVTTSASNISTIGTTRFLKTDIRAKAGVTVSASTVFITNVQQWQGVTVSASNLSGSVNVATWGGVTVSASNVAIDDYVNVTQWAGSSVTSNSIVMRSTSATLLADVLAWGGTAVASARPLVNTMVWNSVTTSASQLAVTDFSTRVNANVQQWAGTSVTTNNIVLRSEISLSVVNVTQWAGTSVTNNSIVMRSTSATLVTAATAGTDVLTWAGVTVSASNLNGSVNVATWNSVTVSSSNAAIQNIPPVNIKQVNGMSVTGSGTAANPWIPD